MNHRLRIVVASVVLSASACARTVGSAAPAGDRPPAVDAAAQVAATEANHACVSTDPSALSACVQRERIEADLRVVTGPRPPGSMHWSRVQSHCAAELESAGFTVALHDFGVGVNVIGTRVGTKHPEQSVVVGAHYDHIPGCAGADDNASGVAGLLEVARILGPVPTERTVIAACWDQEEEGLLGSRAWVAGPMREGTPPVVALILDAIAYVDATPSSQTVPTGFGVLFPGAVMKLAERGNRADFIAVIADAGAAPWSSALQRSAATLELPVAVLEIPEVVKDTHIAVQLQRSDHAAFWDAGVPAILLTDTADFRSTAYHCRGRPDTIDTLDMAFATKVVAAAVHAAAVAATASEVMPVPVAGR